MNNEFKEIKIENLTANYFEANVFENFNATLPAKGCVCFFGPSGCGKTTLLQIIAGLKAPLSGIVYAENNKQEFIDNTKSNNMKALTILSKSSEINKKKNFLFNISQIGNRENQNKNLLKIAYVFQEDRLIPWLTALENVSLITPKNSAMIWLEKVGLPGEESKYPSQLSGGMKQRVNIARALAFDAPVILLDEPFKGLDDAAKLQIIEILNELKKDRLLLLVTHDQEDISLLADNTICMPLNTSSNV